MLVDQEPNSRSAGRRSGRLGGLFLVDTPEQRRMGITTRHELALADWMGSRIRPRRGPLAAPLGRGVRRLRRRREAVLAAGDGAPALPRRRLGRARRRPRRRPRQLGAALPHHLGDRARAGRAVRAAGRGRRRRRAWSRSRSGIGSTSWSSTDGAVDRRPRRRCWSRAMERGARPSRVAVGEFELAAQAVIVTSGGIGGDHDLVRKAWPARLGTAAEHMVAGVPAHVDGRMLGDHRGGRRARSSTRDRMWHYIEGLQELGPDLGQPRHPDPPRPVVAVARRGRQAAARAVLPGLRHPRNPASTSRRRATTTRGSC